MSDLDGKARLEVAGKVAEFDVLQGTDGTPAIDVATLMRQTGHTALDYGFVNTSATKSAITFIDGDKGILRYRGYPIEELAEHSNFLETAYLLIYGELPTREQYEDFQHRITTHTMVHEDIKLFFNGFPRSAHPMPCLLYTSDAADE